MHCFISFILSLKISFNFKHCEEEDDDEDDEGEDDDDESDTNDDELDTDMIDDRDSPEDVCNIFHVENVLLQNIMKSNQN